MRGADERLAREHGERRHLSRSVPSDNAVVKRDDTLRRPLFAAMPPRWRRLSARSQASVSI